MEYIKRGLKSAAFMDQLQCSRHTLLGFDEDGRGFLFPQSDFRLVALYLPGLFCQRMVENPDMAASGQSQRKESPLDRLLGFDFDDLSFTSDFTLGN